MPYQCILHKSVEKFLEKHPELLSTLDTTFIELEKNPFPGWSIDVVPLKWNEKSRYRLRIGKYRFLYEIIREETVLFFYEANSRGQVYKDGR